MKRAFIYLRVSTDEQAEHGNGLDVQRTRCLEYAERNGFSVVEIICDDISGKIYLPARPQGTVLHSRVMRREAEAVIVARVDRLSRDNLNGQLIAREWLGRGIELHFADIGQITDANNIVFLISGWKGETDHGTIVENLGEGRKAKVKRGKVLGGGKPPYGYKYAFEVLPSGRNRVIGLQVFEAEALIVHQIFHLYVNGMSLRTVASTLNAEHAPLPGLTRPCGKPRLRVTRPGWTPQTIRRIVQSETYCGTWTYNKIVKNGKGNGDGPKRRAGENKERINVNVPSIISRETFELAAARCDYNTQFSRRNQKRQFLLSGLTRCACGYAMRGTTSKDRKGNPMRYYRCGQMPKPCGALRTRAETLEAIAWQFVLDVFSDEDKYRSQLVQAAAHQEDERAPKRAERQALLEQMAATEREAIQIASSLVQLGENGIVSDNLKVQARQANARHEDQKARLAVLEAELSEGTLTQHKVESLLEFRQNVALGLEDPTDETKQGNFRDLSVIAARRGEIVRITSLVGEREYRLLSGAERKARGCDFVSHTLLRVFLNKLHPQTLLSNRH